MAADCALAIDWGSVPDWLMAVTAAAAAAFALHQLRLLRASEDRAANAQEAAAKAHQDQVEIARGTFLREIDRDFESEQIVASRKKILVLRSRIEAEVAKAYPNKHDGEQIDLIAEKFSDEVTRIWLDSRSYDGDPKAQADKSADEYMLIMRLPLWCETVGMLCEKELLLEKDVLELYDQMIINTIGNLMGHITKRREAGPSKNIRYLCYAERLHDLAVAHKKKATQLQKVAVAPSGLPKRT